MSEGSPPFDPEERVLRRIFVGAGFYDPEKAPPVEAGAFRPNSHDGDGLSFYLEREVSAERLAGAAGKPADHYVVARLRAGDLYDLGLTLKPTPGTGDLPGHVVVPEINTGAYKDKAQKARLSELCLRLAEVASRDIAFAATRRG